MIPVATPNLGLEELKELTDTINNNWITQGEKVEKFEEKFSKFCGVKHGVACSNGTTALHLALAALNIKEGDEVIVPSLTFISSVNAILFCNAKPIFADCNLDDWCINVNDVKNKITPKTKAIMPVHLYGHPCNMKEIMELAEEKGLFVVEDCAEAHGAECYGKKVGSFGDVNCFSFYGNKIITTGEGGMCLTNNEELKEKMVFLRAQAKGKTNPYIHPEIGFNYRMTDLQAAVGLGQMKKLEKNIRFKRWIAKTYNKHLRESKLTLPVEKTWAKNVYWMYSILTDNRDELMSFLKNKNIESRPFFYPCHKQPFLNTKDDLPNTELVSKKGINLPSGYDLTENKIKQVCEIILEFENESNNP